MELPLWLKWQNLDSLCFSKGQARFTLRDSLDPASRRSPCHVSNRVHTSGHGQGTVRSRTGKGFSLTVSGPTVTTGLTLAEISFRTHSDFLPLFEEMYLKHDMVVRNSVRWKPFLQTGRTERYFTSPIATAHGVCCVKRATERRLDPAEVCDHYEMCFQNRLFHIDGTQYGTVTRSQAAARHNSLLQTQSDILLATQSQLNRCGFSPLAQWSLYVPPGLTSNDSTFCPHSVFMCFVWIWEQTAITSLYNINWLVFITETECVYCAVRTGYLNTDQVNPAPFYQSSINITKYIIHYRKDK